MDDPISKLPKYVFRRANGSYRYKRNVPKALREVIPKATVYRQLGGSYDEAIRRLPVVHAEVEALFDEERSTPNSVRAKSIVRERLGEWHAGVFAEGVVDPEWDVTDDFRELAEELEGSTPPEVVRQVGSARKWFITQCERTGVPEHFTATLVGHHSARSANKLTYGLYSAGISDTQKREIIDQIRLPQDMLL